MGHVLKTLGSFEIWKVRLQPMFSKPRRYFLHGPLQHQVWIFIPEIHFGTVDAVRRFRGPERRRTASRIRKFTCSTIEASLSFISRSMSPITAWNRKRASLRQGQPSFLGSCNENTRLLKHRSPCARRYHGHGTCSSRIRSIRK